MSKLTTQIARSAALLYQHQQAQDGKTPETTREQRSPRDSKFANTYRKQLRAKRCTKIPFGKMRKNASVAVLKEEKSPEDSCLIPVELTFGKHYSLALDNLARGSKFMFKSAEHIMEADK